MVSIVGIDEAGRGPVIGPMVLVGVKIDAAQEGFLISLGVKDSKMLTPQQRERIYEELVKRVKYESIIISPKEIDAAVFSENTNLNWLEADRQADIIKHLAPEKAYIDCPSTNIKKYSSYLQEKVPGVKLIVEHKADATYPVVSAASIIAKVTRDHEIEKIKHKLGIDFGSGYPSDPRTVAFLAKHHQDFPGIFRQSWEPYKKAAAQKMQKSLGEF